MLLRLYDRLIIGLAIAGAASLVFITAAIIVDVLLRNLGFHPFQATSAIVEYVLLFSTMAGAPWLVRSSGHVAISSFVDRLPDGARILAGRIMLTLSVVALAVLSWRSAAVGLQMVDSHAVDMRSVNIPSWVLYAMLSAGFGLMMMEFLRLLLRGEIYNGDEASH